MNLLVIIVISLYLYSLVEQLTSKLLNFRNVFIMFVWCERLCEKKTILYNYVLLEYNFHVNSNRIYNYTLIISIIMIISYDIFKLCCKLVIEKQMVCIVTDIPNVRQTRTLKVLCQIELFFWLSEYWCNNICVQRLKKLHLRYIYFLGFRIISRRLIRFSTTVMGCPESTFNSSGQEYENGKWRMIGKAYTSAKFRKKLLENTFL